jgi:hypothetical protein
MNIKERSEFGKITIADLLEAFAGIPFETEVVISHDDRKYNIQGVYYESSEFDVSKNNALVEIEIGVWRND